MKKNLFIFLRILGFGIGLVGMFFILKNGKTSENILFLVLGIIVVFTFDPFFVDRALKLLEIWRINNTLNKRIKEQRKKEKNDRRN